MHMTIYDSRPAEECGTTLYCTVVQYKFKFISQKWLEVIHIQTHTIKDPGMLLYCCKKYIVVF